MLLLYGLTIFLGASLLFLVQPMFAKMALPLLGGTPAVWNTCMLFFQAALLAGYGYAHLSTRWLGPRRQAALHIAVLALPLLALPLAIPAGWDAPPTSGNPAFWLIGLLVVALGLPFVVVAATNPMLQSWFATTGHPAAKDPYFLSAASNAGSMLALLAYPLAIEPLFALPEQSTSWTAGYALLALATVGCAAALWKSRPPEVPVAAEEPQQAPPLGWKRVAHWVALAFVPSSLMLGVTTYITTDIASAPFIWVIPLAFYLLSFILVFARRPLIPHRWMVEITPLLAAVMIVYTAISVSWSIVPVHLLGFFVAAMMCHGELAADRPSPRHLTAFYLWMSFGGVLGGVFNAIIAPLLFNGPYEYPLAIVTLCLLRPICRAKGGAADRALDIILPVALALAIPAWWDLVESVRSQYAVLSDNAMLSNVLTLLLPCAVCWAFLRRKARFALGVAALAVGAHLHAIKEHPTLFRERSFFGVYTVEDDRTKDGKVHYRRALHGSTLHGLQDPDQPCTPISYYERTGPLGQVFGSLGAKFDNAQVALIGLGTGSIAPYQQNGPGRKFTYYEIDPLVLTIARDSGLFTYLTDCCDPGSIDIVIGDGRLKLREAPNASYKMIVFDAFSSDAIPMHLLTREAIAEYLTKITDDGILLFHISNRYLDLAPVLGRLAADAGCVAYECDDDKKEGDDPGKFDSQYVAIARRPEDLGPLSDDEHWRLLPKEGPLWTDSYSNLVGILKWRRH